MFSYLADQKGGDSDGNGKSCQGESDAAEIQPLAWFGFNTPFNLSPIRSAVTLHFK